MEKRALPLLIGLLLSLVSLAIPAFAHEASTPGKVPTVSTSGDFMGVVDTNGTLWMRGKNVNGGLGNGTRDGSKEFIKVIDNVNTVSCGGYQIAAGKKDGSLWMWGNNYNGALTGDVQEYVLSPKKVMDDVVAVSCGKEFTAAIKSDGSLWTWGQNSSGQLGNGTTENSTIPVRVLEDVSAVNCGNRNVAAIKRDGSLWIWGINEGGLLGSGSMEANFKLEESNLYCQTVPLKIMDDVATVSCSGTNIAAIKTDGSLWIWGDNSYGQLANNSATGLRGSPNPRKVLDNAVSVCCGNYFITAITTDGTMWAWGANDFGQLGNGYQETAHFDDGTPLQLLPDKIMTDVAAVTCGSMVTVIMKKDGSVWACGRITDFSDQSNGTDPYGFPMQTLPVKFSGVTAKLSSPATIASKVCGFTDVLETDYYANPVLWAVQNSITSGTTTTTFSPKNTCTTAQILTFLWRAKGSPEPTSNTNSFTGIKANDYFYKAALWAKENGLVSGIVFNGEMPCTRSTTMNYLWKLAGSPSATPSSFTDVPKGAEHAQAISWAVEQGITQGTSATMFSPDAICTRGQIVTFLHRAYNK